MTETYRTKALAEAIRERDAARERFNATQRFSKAWRNAEEELNAWMSKVAFLSAPAE
jgi:hypothetical protein